MKINDVITDKQFAIIEGEYWDDCEDISRLEWEYKSINLSMEITLADLRKSDSENDNCAYAKIMEDKYSECLDDTDIVSVYTAITEFGDEVEIYTVSTWD